MGLIHRVLPDANVTEPCLTWMSFQSVNASPLSPLQILFLKSQWSWLVPHSLPHIADGSLWPHLYSRPMCSVAEEHVLPPSLSCECHYFEHHCVLLRRGGWSHEMQREELGGPQRLPLLSLLSYFPQRHCPHAQAPSSISGDYLFRCFIGELVKCQARGNVAESRARPPTNL